MLWHTISIPLFIINFIVFLNLIGLIYLQTTCKYRSASNKNIVLLRDAGTRKEPRRADFFEGHRQNFNYVEIHTLEFRGSVSFFLRQILTDHILSIASAITLDFFMRVRFLQLTVSRRVVLSLTKGTLKTYCYIIFFIHKGHFCPLAPPSKRQGWQLPLLPPPQLRRPCSFFKNVN